MTAVNTSIYVCILCLVYDYPNIVVQRNDIKIVTLSNNRTEILRDGRRLQYILMLQYENTLFSKENRNLRTCSKAKINLKLNKPPILLVHLSYVFFNDIKLVFLLQKKFLLEESRTVPLQQFISIRHGNSLTRLKKL